MALTVNPVEHASGFRGKRASAGALLMAVLIPCGYLLAACQFTSAREQQQRITDDYRLAQADGRRPAAFAKLTVAGEIASLQDPRFSTAAAVRGLWRPLDAAATSPPGVYFLAPFDATRVPVLFVHGMGGSPANFVYLIDQLDRSRFQPWVYSYPSGAPLDVVVDHLEHTIGLLQSRQHFKAMAIVAHSMGGLVARGFILRHARTAPTEAIPLFVTISTPWDGHTAAEHVPSVVNLWRDIVPGSEYLTSLFATRLPATTRHYLFFTFNRKTSSFGASNDHTVTVASQLATVAQQEAVRIVGFDDTHEGVLRNADVALMLDHLLAETFVSGGARGTAVAFTSSGEAEATEQHR
jgi:pimeloyl-ACP methyl ester carboxylesterase